jgi:uncharacterized membrane protein
MTFITAFVYIAGSFVCHQISDRSFHIAGVQLPVCARCTGLYLGAAIGAIAWFAVSVSQLSFARVRVALIAAAVPTVVTVITASAGVWDPGNALRATCAAPLGIAVGALVAAVFTRRLR